MIPFNSLFTSYSVNENGLEAIFSSKRLEQFEDKQLTLDEKEKMFYLLSSFKTPNFLFKAKYYFMLELQIFFGNILSSSLIFATHCFGPYCMQSTKYNIPYKVYVRL